MFYLPRTYLLKKEGKINRKKGIEMNLLEIRYKKGKIPPLGLVASHNGLTTSRSPP